MRINHSVPPGLAPAMPDSMNRARRHLLALAALGALGLRPAAAATPACSALLTREFPRLQDEKPQNLCQYAGKVIVVVNTASFCGFTPQYKGLEALYEKYHGKGLEVLGFPCNQFGAQEPGTEDEIAQFCELNFGVTFPLFAKVDVNGDDAALRLSYDAEIGDTTQIHSFGIKGSAKF